MSWRPTLLTLPTDTLDVAVAAFVGGLQVRENVARGLSEVRSNGFVGVEIVGMESFGTLEPRDVLIARKCLS